MTLPVERTTGDPGLRLPGVVTATSLQLPEGLSFTEWEAVGRTLDRLRESVHWWRGDWLRYGERTYGERYSRVLDPGAGTYQTLANDAWVAGKIGLSLRRENVPWSHHKEIAPLQPDEQAAFLDQTEHHGWSVRELRERIRQHKRLPPPAPRAPGVKIPEDQWQGILDRVDAGETQASLAAEYGVSEARISGIVQTQRAAVRRAAARLKAQQDPTKSHRQAHAERLAAYEEAARAREQEAEEGEGEGAGVPAPLYDAVCPADALSYLRDLPDGIAHLCVTSPPYWAKRQYTGDPLELGREPDPDDYVRKLVEIVDEIGRVLAPGAYLFLNLGDTYASQPGRYRGDEDRRRGISELAIRANGTALDGRVLDVPEKSLVGIPWRVALGLTLRHGWRCANVVCWVKEGAARENVHDRLRQQWEPILVLTKAQHAYLNHEPLRDVGTGDVWDMRVGRRGEAAGHYAPFPEELVGRAIAAACPPGGVVLDPFAGSGTTLQVARRMGRRFLGCDLSPGEVAG